MDSSPPSWIKLNFDVAYVDNLATCAVVFRDPKGHILYAWTGQFRAANSFCAEALAIVNGLKIAEDKQLPQIIAEGDAWNVIKALHGDLDAVDWRGQTITDEAQSALSRHNNWKVVYTSRMCNRTAHNLASWARTQGIFGFLQPSLLPHSVFCDAQGIEEVLCCSYCSING